MEVEKINMALFPLLLILICYWLLFLISDIRNNKILLFENSKNCKSLDLLFVANCLNQELRTFYKYNLSNARLFINQKVINWSIIKEQGGVCWHYSKWYIENFKNYGFKAESLYLDETENYTGHEFVKVYNNDNSIYCIMDQTSYWCNTLNPISKKTYWEIAK